MAETESGSRLDDGPGLLSGWRYRAVFWSVVAAAACYMGFVLWSGWEDVVNAVTKVGFVGVAVSFGLSLVNYGLRFVRWQLYLAALEYPVSWRPSLEIYIAGFALTTTPGKAGEAIRGVLLKRLGVPYSASLAAFLSERLSDLLAIVILTLFGLTVYPAARPMVLIGAAAVLLAFIALSNERVLTLTQRSISGSTKILTLLRHLIGILLQARRCHSLKLIVASTLLGMVAWTAEAWAFHLILRWMGLEISLTFSIFVYAISMLAGALSFLPGGLGGAEAAMAGLLMWKGVSSADAVAATILLRIATLWFAVAIGLISLSRNPLTRRT